MDQARHAATLAAALQAFDARRTRARTEREELAERRRQAAANQRRTNGYVLLGVGALFLLFAVGCFALAVDIALGGDHGSLAFVAIFGLFWLLLGGGMLYGALRYSRAGRRDRLLRSRGVRGRATIRSYLAHRIVLDGNPKYELVLEVEVPGRPPCLVRQADWVARPDAVTTGAELPVFVNPSNPNDVMVDWFAA